MSDDEPDASASSTDGADDAPADDADDSKSENKAGRSVSERVEEAGDTPAKSTADAANQDRQAFSGKPEEDETGEQTAEKPSPETNNDSNDDDEVDKPDDPNEADDGSNELTMTYESRGRTLTVRPEHVAYDRTRSGNQTLLGFVLRHPELSEEGFFTPRTLLDRLGVWLGLEEDRPGQLVREKGLSIDEIMQKLDGAGFQKGDFYDT